MKKLELKQAVIFDVDGTLADCEHRRKYIAEKPKDYESFYHPANVIQDPVIEPIAKLARTLSVHIQILIVTARRFEDLEVTKEWLTKHNIYFDKIYIREQGDRRKDEIFKREVLEKIRAEGYEVEMVFDDRDRVVKMWREQGLTCLQVAPGDF